MSTDEQETLQSIDIHPTPLNKKKKSGHGYRSISTSLQDNLAGLSVNMIDEHINNAKSVSDDVKEEEKQLEQSDDIYTTHLNDDDNDEIITQQPTYIPPQPKQSMSTSETIKWIRRCPKKSMNWSKPKLAVFAAVVSRSFALVDMITDINLLYASSQAQFLFLTVTLFLSIIAPYLLQYSCGIKLFTLRRTFERLTGFKRILIALYLLPTGVLYFVFLDIYDLFFNFYALFQLLCGCKSWEEVKELEAVLAGQLSVDRITWEGLKRQKIVSQLMFESIPQVTIQALLYLSIIQGTNTVKQETRDDLLLSIAAAALSSFTQIVKLVLESEAVKESFFQYSLTCFMARIGWVPFRSKIRRVLDNEGMEQKRWGFVCCAKFKCCRKNKKDTKICTVDFHIKYAIPFTQCIHTTYNDVEYDFSEDTLKDLMATIMLKKEISGNSLEYGEGKRLEIKFHESLRLLDVIQLVDLLRECSNRLIIIRGLNNPKLLSWENSLNISRTLGRDATTLKYCRDSVGRPHLMSIYESEFRLKHFAKHVYKSKIKAHKTHALLEMIESEHEYDFKVPIIIPERQCLPVLFNKYDDPIQIATQYCDENPKLKGYCKCLVATQIISVDPNHETEYVLEKLKVLLKVIYYLQEDESWRNDYYGSYLLSAYDESEDGIKYVDFVEIVKISSEMNTFENTLLDIIYYLDDIGEIQFDWKKDKNTGKVKGIIYQNTPIYLQCINLDFDINAIDIATGESLIFTLIKHNDEQNLRTLLFEYGTKNKIKVNIDIHNNKGKSPLYYALKEHKISNSSLYLLLLKADADANFPCIKRGQKTQSPISFLLSQIYDSDKYRNYWKIIKELIYYGAAIYTHEVNMLPKLLIPKKINEFNFDNWQKNLDQFLIVLQQLKLPLNAIEDENGNNPMHLLLNKYFSTKNNSDTTQLHTTENINANIVALCKLFDNDFKWISQSKNSNSKSNTFLSPINMTQIADMPLNTLADAISREESRLHETKEEESNDFRMDILRMKAAVSAQNDFDLQSLAKFYFGVGINVNQYLKEIINNQNNQESDTVDNIGVRDRNIISIMDALHSCNWNWILNRNHYGNLPIAAIFREDQNAINVLKEAHSLLDTTFKQKLFIDSIKNNRFSMIIICNYIIFQILNAKNNDNKDAQNPGIISNNKRHRPTRQSKPVDSETVAKLQQYGSDFEMEPSEDPLNIKEIKCEVKKEEENKTVWKTIEIHKEWNKIEVLYMAIVESLSVGDLITDIIVLHQLIVTDNQWWTAFMLLFLLAPYLVSFCALSSIFQNRTKDVTNVLAFVLITPLSIVFLISIDLIFMLFVVLNLFILSMCFWRTQWIRIIDQDIIFQYMNLTHMEIKGYRRLRTLSQLIFETLPQTILQVRMLWVIKFEEHQALGAKPLVSIKALIISLVIAAIHFSFEVLILWIESRAAKLTVFQYGIQCLNARLNWVPLLNVIFREYDQNMKGNNMVDWENLQHSLVCFKKPYHLDYEFAEGSFARLYTQITRVPHFTDGSATECEPLETLLPKTTNIAVVKLGKHCCKFVTLRDLSRLYRNADNRIILNGKDIVWKNKVVEMKQDKEIEDPTSLFHDFMQHGEIDAIFALWHGIKGREKIKISKLKRETLLQNISDIYTMKQFWKHNYSFGNSCDECHIIYDRILKYYDKMLTLNKLNKSETSDELTQYSNMILLMLWFTRSSILCHRCPQCNISWKQYIIDKLPSRKLFRVDVTVQLPNYVEVLFNVKINNEKENTTDKNDNKCCVCICNGNKSDNSTIVNSEVRTLDFIKIPFILAECSDVLSEELSKNIFTQNTRINQPIFQTKRDIDPSNTVTWQWVDTMGNRKAYDEDAMEEINSQFKIKLNKWKNKKKQLAKQQREMSYTDNFIEIDLTKGPIFGPVPNKFKIIIDYNQVPPKYEQINVEKNYYKRTVKRVQNDRSLKIKSSINEIQIKKDDFQACVNILSSIMEYDVYAPQSFEIMKSHYDLTDSSSQFQNLIKVAKILKLRNGYDKLLTAIQPFYQKEDIEVNIDGMNVQSVRINLLKAEANNILGISKIKVNVIIDTVYETQENKYDPVDNRNDIGVYNRPNMTSGRLVTVRHDAMDTEESEPSNVDDGDTKQMEKQAITPSHEQDIVCGLWLKVPVNEKQKQIDSWNDILLLEKSINIKLNTQTKALMEIDLATCPRLGLWNPLLYFCDQKPVKQKPEDDESDKKVYFENLKNESDDEIPKYLEFEVKIKDKYNDWQIKDDVFGYELHCLITGIPMVQVIIDDEEETKIIEDYAKIAHPSTQQTVIWKWKDKNEYKPYDREANEEIETKYKQKMKYMNKNNNINSTIIIPITKGKWANKKENKNKYQIRIIQTKNISGVKGNVCYEVNVQSGSTRLVKRDVN